MNLIEKTAEALGRTVGSFQKGIRDMTQGARAAFIGAWAESQKWSGGDWAKRGAQRRALQNSWLYAAVELIAREASQAKFGVVRQTGYDDEPVSIPNHPLEKVIRRPNPWIGRAFLWQYTVLWLLLDGNAYWFIALDDAGEVEELWPLPANDVEVMPGDENRFIDYYEYTANGTQYNIPAEYIVHYRLPNPFDIFRGLSPLIAAMLPTDSDTAMARWNGRFFDRDNVMPSAIINLSSGNADKPIDPADAQALKNDLRSEYAASSRKTAITSANSIQAVLLGWNPKEMDFISGRQFTKEEIFAIYSISAGALDKNATEANAVVAKAQIKDTTWGHLTMIAEQMTAELVGPYYGRDLEASFDDIRQANRALELQEADLASRFFFIDEIRERYWKSGPMPNGEGQRLASAAQAGPDIPSSVFGMPNYGLPQTSPEGAAATRSLPMADYSGDLRKWRDKAVKAFKSEGSGVVKFTSTLIPLDVYADLHARVSGAKSLDDIRAAFDSALGVAQSPSFFQGDGNGWESYG